MPTFIADWVLPIVDEPIARGVVTIEGDRIAALGAQCPADATDFGRVAILPALVNAHTHLELSYLRGRVPPAQSFHAWVKALMALRRDYPDPATGEIVDAARAAHPCRFRPTGDATRASPK